MTITELKSRDELLEKAGSTTYKLSKSYEVLFGCGHKHFTSRSHELQKIYDLCDDCHIEKCFENDDITVNDNVVFWSCSQQVVPKRMKFKIRCSCGKEKITCFAVEQKLKHSWKCKACAISLSWNEQSYRQNHLEKMKIAHKNDETRAKHSASSKKNWQNEDLRKRMFANRLAPEALAKSRETFLRNVLSGKTKIAKSFSTRCSGYHTSWDGKRTWLRSSYEFRFASILDKHNIEYVVEHKAFRLQTLNRCYIPDFYLPKTEHFIEIKGYWYEDALKKWKAFCEEYPNVLKSVIYKDLLIKLEKEEKLDEAYIEKICREEKCL